MFNFEKRKEEKAMRRQEAKQKLLQIQSTQGFSPIRDVLNGIIVTKNGDFVKLMEFTPINFNLRSADEQAGIISSFAAALHTMPATIQLKVVARRADVTHFLDVLEDHYDHEENERCRNLQLEQMALIDQVGRDRGITRRFFLIFKYEDPGGLKRKPSWQQIVNNLDNTAASIRNSLEMCGNEYLSPDNDDEWVLDTLYSLMSRSQSDIETYDEHELRTLARYAAQQGYDFSRSYNLPANDLVCPSIIDNKASAKYIMVGGSEGSIPLYYTFAYLPGNTYPSRCVAGWTSILINIAEGVDLDIYVHKENPENIIRRLSYGLRVRKMEVKETEDTDSGYDEIVDSIESGYYLKDGIAGGEDFCYFGCMLTITGTSVDELEYRYNEIRRHLLKRDLHLKRCNFQMLEAFEMSLPLAQYNSGIFNKMKRNILGSQLASLYPFVSYEMSDENGLLLGTQQNGSLVLLDNFDTKKYNNANMAILGSSGAGKTYLLQCMALRYREKQTQVFIIAPDKGHEFKRACEAIGGQFITIAPGSGQNINIMEIRKKDERKTVLIDGEGEDSNSILSSKIQSLHTFFSLLVPDISYEERQLLDEALMRTYQRYGINTNNKSLDDPKRPGKYKKMPILGDLHVELKKGGEPAQRLYNILGRYVHGSASSFNQPTNVNLDNKYVVLDVSKLTKEMLPVGMFISLDYVWDKAREDRTAKKVIFMDEGWKLIGPSASREASEFATEVFKVIRGYGGAAIIATQDLNDFMALNNGEFGKAIINNSKTKIIMKVERSEAETLAETLDLTSVEIEQIVRMKRGNGLLVANSNHVFIEVQASKTEHNLITTDRSDLAELANERARKQEQ